MRTRAYRKALVAVLFAHGERAFPAPAFAALLAATDAFERRRYAQGVALLCSVPRTNALEIARRHHATGLVTQWLDEASQTGIAVPDDLREPFLRVRWTAALQAVRVLSCVRDVRSRFERAGIPHIFLKGAARLATDQPGADLQFAGDVDVIVPNEKAGEAVATLRRAGYVDTTDDSWKASHASWLHHREPVLLPEHSVPVEVHSAIAPVSLVSQRLDFALLQSLSRHGDGPTGAVYVLDDVGSALNLAYHARDLHVWRDIVLLSRLLREMDGKARARFDAYVMAEKRDGLRLASAVAAADAIGSNERLPNRELRRYLTWARIREDLPRGFGYPELIEAIVGNCLMRRLQIPESLRDVPTWIRCWIRNLVLLPVVARIALRGGLLHVRDLSGAATASGYSGGQ